MAKKYENYTRDELVCEICRLKSCKKFGLVWEDKPEDVAIQCEEQLPVLREIPELTIDCATDKQDNYIIEGDNYHALSVLNYTHAGKIDVIYIDPPYNTGNKDFVYNDKFVDIEDTYRHSKWLSFMEKRLNLAKNLLSDSGVIFISIDDNEYAHLKLLCDEIFGEEKFITNIVIESGEVFGTKAAHADKTFVKTKDYVLVYSKNKSIFDTEKKQPLYDSMRELYDSHFNTIINDKLQKSSFIDYIENTKHIKKIFDEKNLKINNKNINILMSIDETFKDWIYSNVSKILYADAPLSKKIPDEILNKHSVGTPFLFENKLILKTRTGSVRMYLNFFDSLHLSDDFNPNYSRCSIRGDLWKNFHFDMRNVQDEGAVDFKNGKKPSRLIRQLIKWYNKQNSIILDFFAGSGTTGQAVLDLNAEDGGNRQFILCTNNENNIARTVTYPRIKTVITGIRPDGSKYSEGLPANVKYLVADDFVPKTASTVQLKVNLTKKCTTMLCLKEACFNKIESIKDKYAFYTNNAKDKTICIFYGFSDDTIDDFIGKVRNIQGHKILYVFSLDEMIDNRMFKGITDYVIEPIPQKIMEIYRRIHKKGKK